MIVVLMTVSCSKKGKLKSSTVSSENNEIEVYNFDQLESVLSSETDKTLVINFWATWCKPCIKELPYFEALQENYVEDVKVVLVSLDFPNKLDTQLIPFVSKNKLQSQVILLDDPYENEWIPRVDSTWSGAIPATLMIDKEERKFFERSFTMEELENELLKFIKV